MSDLADRLQHAAEYGEATKELMLEAAKIVRELERDTPNGWSPKDVLEMLDGWERAYYREGRGIPSEDEVLGLFRAAASTISHLIGYRTKAEAFDVLEELLKTKTLQVYGVENRLVLDEGFGTPAAEAPTLLEAIQAAKEEG